jgi:hypothetical protein
MLLMLSLIRLFHISFFFSLFSLFHPLLIIFFRHDAAAIVFAAARCCRRHAAILRRLLR